MALSAMWVALPPASAEALTDVKRRGAPTVGAGAVSPSALAAQSAPTKTSLTVSLVVGLGLCLMSLIILNPLQSLGAGVILVISYMVADWYQRRQDLSELIVGITRSTPLPESIADRRDSLFDLADAREPLQDAAAANEISVLPPSSVLAGALEQLIIAPAMSEQLASRIVSRAADYTVAFDEIAQVPSGSRLAAAARARSSQDTEHSERSVRAIRAALEEDLEVLDPLDE